MAGIPDSEAQQLMGQRLRAIRELRGLTQEQMGEVMGAAITTISGWESGRNQIDIVKLARAAKLLGFTTDWVAMGDTGGLRFSDVQQLQRISENPNSGQIRRGRPSRNCVARLGTKPESPVGRGASAEPSEGTESAQPLPTKRRASS